MSSAARVKPNAEELKARLRGALTRPDAPQLSVVPQPQPEAAAAAPAAAAVQAPMEQQAAPAAASQAYSPPAPVPAAPPAPPPAVEPAARTEAAPPIVEPAFEAPAPAPAKAPAAEPAAARAEEGRGRAEVVSSEPEKSRVGRKKNADPLRNITLSMRDDHCNRLMELTAYERLRLGRAVDMSEIVRHLVAVGLANVADNKVLPDEGRS